MLIELADFDMDMITHDQCKGQPVRDRSRAVAWVVHNDSNERSTQMYFAYWVPIAQARWPPRSFARRPRPWRGWHDVGAAFIIDAALMVRTCPFASPGFNPDR